MPFFQVSWIVIRYPHSGLIIFPDNRFLRQIDGNTLLTLHKGAAHFRVAEYYESGFSELDAHFSSGIGMVYLIEDRHAFFIQYRSQVFLLFPLHCTSFAHLSGHLQPLRVIS